MGESITVQEMKDSERVQREICERIGVEFTVPQSDMKLGIARNVLDGLLPINGLRHRPEGDTTGWYLWAGETLSDDPEFFVPLCIEHLDRWCPAAIPYLGLPPGWRFLVAGDDEDVWEDRSLLDT